MNDGPGPIYDMPAVCSRAKLEEKRQKEEEKKQKEEERRKEEEEKVRFVHH